MSATLTHAYCTVDDLREQLGDLTSQSLSERQLIRAINAASRAVDNYTDRRFWMDATPTTQLFQPWTDVRRQMTDYVATSYEMWLPADIASSTGLQIATDTNGDGGYATVWGASDFRLWPFDRTAAEEYGRLAALLERKGRRMQVVDIRLAAIAFTLGNCTVVTTDSDPSAVPGLTVENWAA